MKLVLLAGLRTHHRAVINWLAAISATFVGVRTALLGVHEVVPFGAEVGELGYDAGLAYLTAWFFQLLVIALPAGLRAERHARTVAPRVDSLIELGFMVAEGINRAIRADSAQFPIPPETVRTAIDGAKPDDDFPGWGDTWTGVLVHVTRRAEDVRTRLKPFYPVLDEHLLEALEHEETRARDLVFALRAGRTLRRTHLRDLADPMAAWLTAVHRLLEMRRSSLAVDVPAPTFRPNHRGVRLPLDRVEADFARFLDDLDS